MNRRTFIKATTLSIPAMYLPRSQANSPVLVEAGCIILGTAIIGIGVYMGYKLYKVAKDKLYPPPPVPPNNGTNQPPPPPSGTHKDACMGYVLSESECIHLIDMAQMTDEDKAKNVLPDGTQADHYANLYVANGETLDLMTRLDQIQIWFSNTCYVVKCGTFCQWGHNSINDPATGMQSMRPVVMLDTPDTATRFFKL